MAIAFDAASGQVGFVIDAITWAHTCAGSDRILWVGVRSTQGSPIATVTYNGVSLTEAKHLGFAGEGIGLWYLVAPATGANNIVATAGGAITDLLGCAASFTGAKQTGVPDSVGPDTGNVSGTSHTVSTTTVADNCWMVMFGVTTGTSEVVSAGASTTRRDHREGTANTSCGLFDSNAALTPAGSKDLIYTHATSQVWAAVAVSFEPSAGAPPPDFIPFTRPRILAPILAQ